MPEETFTFAPALYDGTELFYLPQTVEVFQIPWKWVMTRHSTPYRNGVRLYPTHAEPPVVTIGGIFAKQGEEVFATEEDMFTLMNDLRNYLDALAPEDRLELFVYYNEDDEVYRKFKGVRHDSLAVEMGENAHHAFGYTLTLQMEDPEIYNTAPGL